MKIYDLAEHEDLTTRQIAAKVGTVTASTVSYLLRQPDRYDPYLDQVAITRALAGDRPVLDALTVWEWEEVIVRLRAVQDSLSGPDWQAFLGALMDRLSPDGGVARELLSKRFSKALLRVAEAA